MTKVCVLVDVCVCVCAGERTNGIVPGGCVRSVGATPILKESRGRKRWVGHRTSTPTGEDLLYVPKVSEAVRGRPDLLDLQTADSRDRVDPSRVPRLKLTVVVQVCSRDEYRNL